jgi:hypothetical protein
MVLNTLLIAAVSDNLCQCESSITFKIIRKSEGENSWLKILNCEVFTGLDEIDEIESEVVVEFFTQETHYQP